LIQEELKVVWLAVKLDGKSFCSSLEELCSRLIRVVEDIRISKGRSQCKMGSCWSCHGDQTLNTLDCEKFDELVKHCGLQDELD
jgi:hypothetical protein